ncbi:regulator of G-protein signaling 5-like [Hypomesus transpacificus]|uniref:regulator of G-protein signaling 5-like n=1 Tax=Hypomesus transpacificus TaxID=137520 RepID=UPI001F083349|nr:regulator of G-protein signaling 5-like [Hypomesus transpacificus]
MCKGLTYLSVACLERVKELKARLGSMLQKHDWTHASSKAGKDSPTLEECLRWSESFERLLSNKYGLCAFTAFLVSEFSEENVAFYVACEDYRKIRVAAKLPAQARSIYDEFIACDAPKEVNIDHETRDITKANLQAPSASCFELAQHKIYTLMEKDCYPRFLRSAAYRDMASQLAAGSGAKQTRPGRKV